MTRSPGALLVGAALAVLSATALVPARAAGVTVSSQNLTPLRSCVVTATPTTTTSVLDSRVQQANATTNYGTATGTTVQSGSSANIRTYVEFSLSGCSPAIPSTATVRLATLRLYVTARSAVCRTLDVFTATVSWTESAITWNNQPFGTTLNNPASGSRVASFNVGNIAGCQNQALGYAAGATVTGAVQSIVAGTASNFGWMIRDDAENSAITYTETFAAKELGTLSESPQLVVSYVDVP